MTSSITTLHTLAETGQAGDTAPLAGATAEPRVKARIIRVPFAGSFQLRYPMLLSVLTTVLVLFVAWFTVGPQQLGGPTSFAITSGVSMLPDFHAGDLVILRKEASYHVGEVAAYHNAELHMVVMHRIVAIRGSHYVFKGDNNHFPDNYMPTKSQIVGAEWAHLAGWGRWILDLRNPYIAAVMFALIWVLSFRWAPKRRRRRARQRRAQ